MREVNIRDKCRWMINPTIPQTGVETPVSKPRKSCTAGHWNIHTIHASLRLKYTKAQHSNYYWNKWQIDIGKSKILVPQLHVCYIDLYRFVLLQRKPSTLLNTFDNSVTLRLANGVLPKKGKETGHTSFFKSPSQVGILDVSKHVAVNYTYPPT